MPNGQGGEEQRYDPYGFTLTSAEIRQRQESIERLWMQQRRNDLDLQSFYNNTTTSSFTVTTEFDGIWFSPPLKQKRPARPVSAIFYPMVNECGY